MISEIETDRLLLRGFREEDLDAYAAMCADPEVMRYLGGSGPLTRAEAWRHMAVILGHWPLRGFGMWAAVEKASGALVGRVGPWQPEGWPGFEVGWMLGRAWWGRGLAIEAARACLRHAFSAMGRERVISLIHPENRRSIRVAERLGERPEGTFEIAGVRAVIYGISREDFAA